MDSKKQVVKQNAIFEYLRDSLFANRFMGYPGYCLKRYVKKVAKIVENGSDFLDAGAGECQYKKYFSHVNYVSQDNCIGDNEWDFSYIDIKSEIYNIQVENKSFDYILCMEVLEHLRYPHLAFKEFHRILRPGGKLFLVCPLSWQQHQKPHDYFRYTYFALKMLGEEYGFELQEVNKEGGKFTTLMQIINGIIPTFFIERGFNKIGRLSQIVLYPVHFPLGVLFYFLDKLDREKDYTPQFECIYINKS